jgi:hypothetical protein
MYTVCVKESKTEPESQWQKNAGRKLVRNAASDIYYARVRVAGKLIWKSLKTDRMSSSRGRIGKFAAFR